jgi:hypothetical protein
MVSGAIVLYQGKRGAGQPVLKCRIKRIEAPLGALNFTCPSSPIGRGQDLKSPLGAGPNPASGTLLH